MQHRFSVATSVFLALLLVLAVACGGSSSKNSNNPTSPTITSLSVSSATVGATDTSITVTGTNYESTSVVQWAGTSIATTYVSSTQLTAVIPAANLTTAGTFSVTVRNTTTNAVSNSITFTVTAAGPAISAVSPSSVLAGSAGFTLRVSGSGYVSGSVVNWDGTPLTTSYLNTSQLSVDVPASVIASSKTVSVTVTTPGTGGKTSSSHPFNVNAPLPAVTGVNPSNVSAGSGGVSLTVTGNNFVANSTVRIGTTDKTTTFISPNQVVATIPASDLASAGTLAVSVNNPTPGGGLSNSLNMNVTAATGNRRPVANAGRPQTVATGVTVHLDGSRSTDADGNTLTYTWSLSAPSGSTATLSSTSDVQPTFVADLAGNYVVQLTVSDGTLSSTASVTISTVNSAPVADAGRDQTALFGATVQLDGTASTDVDGNALSYSWTLVSAPAGSSATLSNAGTARPSFTIDRPGNYVAQLVVSDGTLSSAPAIVTVSTVDSLPFADAGAGQTVAVGSTVHLDGSKTVDVDGDPLTFRWAILSAPAGSNASLSSATDVRPTFVADRAGLYVLQLIANDGTGDGAPSTITVSTVNTPPVASAGADQAIAVGAQVQLDATPSTDADGNKLSYRWAIVSKPAGSTATAGNSFRQSFTADLAGTYVAQLIVNDGQVNSLPAVVRFSTVATAPVANAGPQQNVSAGSTVQLDGTHSSSASGKSLTYQWSLLSKPVGSVAYIASPTLATPAFVADVAGDYIAQLIVSDGTQTSTPATVTISTSSVAPIANAGAGWTVAPGTVVQLDGSASIDPGGNTLSYSWALIEAPSGSAATLTGAATKTPSFQADLAGDYVLQLTVNNGTLTSAPSNVRISTVHSKPTASAGIAQQALVGASVSLDGSGSNSPDGASLTYKWSMLSVPAGSTAALSSASAMSPSLTIDKRGTYIAQLIVTDGVYTTDPSTVTITTNNRPPVANAGADQSVPVTTSVTLDGTGSTSPDGYPLTYNWSFTSLPDGANPTLTGTSKVTFVPDQVGTYVAQLIVNDGLASAPSTVTITTTANKTISFSTSPLTMDASSSSQEVLTLGQAAPTGGLTVTLTSSDTTILTVPASVTVAAGSTTAIFNVTSLAKAGTATVTAKASGYTDGTLSVTVSARTLSFETLNVGKNLQVATQLTLGSTAPTAGVNITLKSSDPSKVVLSTTALSQGSASITIKVSSSTTSPTFYVQALDGSGTATLTATGSGYADGSTTVTLVPAGFFVTNITSIDTTTLSADTTFSVASGSLDPVTLKPTAIQQLRAGLGNVSVSIDDPNKSIGTITTNPLVFNPGISLVQTAFHPLAVGNMNLTVTPPSNFTAPSQSQVIPVTVSVPSINIGTVSVGKDLQVQDGAWLEAPAPTNGVDVTLTSSDPSKVLLSTSASAAGSTSITLHYAQGYSAQLYFYVQALANSGSVTLTAKGTGYADSTATVSLLPSGFIISNGNITNATVGGPDVPIGIASAALDSSLNFFAYQQMRAGVSATNVAVASSNAAVATITTTPLVFNATDTSHSTALHPIGAGNTAVSISTPAGFSTPVQFQSISATVLGPGINTNTNINVGKDLMMSSSFALSTTPPSPVTVTVTSSAPSIATVSTTNTTAGVASVSFPNVSTQTPTFYVQALATGTATLAIQAPGYGTANVTVTVYPSGFILTRSDFSASTNTDTAVTIAPAMLLPGTLDVYDVQPLRPGISVQVPIASSDTSIGTVVSPVTVTGGSGSTTFHAIAAGSTYLSLTTPAGYSTPSVYQQIKATVAGITTTGTLTTGKDLMTSSIFALNTVPSSAVTVTITSNNPSIATVSTSATTAGTSSVTFSSITTQTPAFYVQGLATGTATLTISATGYANATVTVTVNPSGFVLTTNSFSTPLGTDATVAISPAVLVPGTLDISVLQSLRPGVSVQVPIASSATTIGTINSPVSITGGSATATFHPVAKGSTNLTLSTPSGYSTPSSGQQITATVQ